jgi:hypothetical protein
VSDHTILEYAGWSDPHHPLPPVERGTMTPLDVFFGIALAVLIVIGVQHYRRNHAK